MLTLWYWGPTLVPKGCLVPLAFPLGLPSIATRPLDICPVHPLLLLLRASPFSVAPSPLGPAFPPRGYVKCSS